MKGKRCQGDFRRGPGSKTSCPERSIDDRYGVDVSPEAFLRVERGYVRRKKTVSLPTFRCMEGVR